MDMMMRYIKHKLGVEDSEGIQKSDSIKPKRLDIEGAEALKRNDAIGATKDRIHLDRRRAAWRWRPFSAYAARTAKP